MIRPSDCYVQTNDSRRNHLLRVENGCRILRNFQRGSVDPVGDPQEVQYGQVVRETAIHFIVATVDKLCVFQLRDCNVKLIIVALGIS